MTDQLLSEGRTRGFFRQIVFWIEDEEIIEDRLEDLLHRDAEEQAMSLGLKRPSAHVHGNDFCMWMPDGTRSVEGGHDSPEEAETELLNFFLWDFDVDPDNPTIYYTREEAEAALKEILENEDQEYE